MASLLAQDIPLGTWRTHFNYETARGICVYQDKIYSRAERSLLVYTPSTDEVEVLTQINGLSGAEITAMATDGNILAVGYVDGSIDLIEGHAITSLTFLRRFPQDVGKEIHALFFAPNKLYAAGAFGLLRIDLPTLLIDESFLQLGKMGEAVAVQGGLQDGAFLFLLLEDEVLVAVRNNDANLLDYRNWQRYTFLGVRALATWQGRTLLMHTHDGNTQLHLFMPAALGDTPWVAYQAFPHAFTFLYASEGRLLLGNQTHYALGEDGTDFVVRAHKKAAAFQDALWHDDALWFADSSHGLMRLREEITQYFVSSGPEKGSYYTLDVHDGRLFAFPRYHDEVFTSQDPQSTQDFTPVTAFSFFEAGRWNRVAVDDRMQCTASATHPQDGKLYVTGFGSGVWSYDHIAQRMVKLPAPSFSAADAFGVALAFHPTGRMYVGCRHAAEPLLVYDDGLWETPAFFRLPAGFPTQLLSGPGGIIWCLWQGELRDFVVALDDAKQRYFVVEEIDDFLGQRVYDLAFDEAENLWIAHSRGLLFIRNTREIVAQQRVQYGRASLGEYFVFQQVAIRNVLVDAGSRKWVGETAKWSVMDEYKGRVTQVYTPENSPLGERMYDTALHPSGELFVSTGQGLVSYRSRTSSPHSSYQSVKIFPNPVPPHYKGYVGISGLLPNSLVKITDMMGHLVGEVPTYGGTASWNVRDARGRAVQAGIYIVYVVQVGGQERYVGKIAVIR